MWRTWRMALRRFVQLFGEEADEVGPEPAPASGPLELDRILDSPLSTYSPYRVTLTLVLASWWLVSSDVYADVWAAHAPNMARCVCASAADPPPGGGADVLFADLVNYSRPSDNPRACAACAARGGRPSCPAEADASTMATSFAIYCERDWLLGLPPSFDMTGVLFGSLAGGRIADRYGQLTLGLGLLLGLGLGLGFGLG